GFLAEKVELVARGQDNSPPFSWAELLAMLPRTIGREARKLAYFAPRALALLVLSFIPLANLAAAPLWLLFGIWMMAVQYIDYPADNNKMSWGEMMNWLRGRRWKSLSFGAATYAALLVPVLNLLIMPAAVAGATRFWVREGGHGQAATHRAAAWAVSPRERSRWPGSAEDPLVRYEARSGPAHDRPDRRETSRNSS